MKSPTEEFYPLLSRAFEHFNSELFENSLPSCLLTVQRETNTMGYFSPDRWGNRLGEKAHEIAINPAYFASHSLVEVLQTLVHEQCHLWQQVHGRRKSRHGYHNREWAAKMESIGLMPSQSGLPGGKKTGQQMSDYPVPGAAFLVACEKLVDNGYELLWVDRIPAVRESCQLRGREEAPLGEHGPGSVQEVLATRIDELVPDITPLAIVAEEKGRKNKTRYTCPGCGTNIWGKPRLRVKCMACNSPFRVSA